MIFTHSWPVTTEGSDSTGRMTLPYLCNLLQETATFHADELGWGYDALKKANLLWVLSRQWILLKRMPKWKEEVTVTTWPSAKGAITWNRDFRLTDSKGDEIGVATSLWLVIDETSRRPSPAKPGPDMPTDGAQRVRETDLKPLGNLERPEVVRRIIAGWHDIDVHHHINNLKYLTWMIDGLDPDFLTVHEPREIEINFMQEGFLGDVLDVGLDQSDGDGTVRFQNLVRESDGAELCRLRSTWQPGH